MVKVFHPNSSSAGGCELSFGALSRVGTSKASAHLITGDANGPGQTLGIRSKSFEQANNLRTLVVKRLCISLV
jgi:hypothetical protein